MELTLNEEEVKKILLDHVNKQFVKDGYFNYAGVKASYGGIQSVEFSHVEVRQKPESE